MKINFVSNIINKINGNKNKNIIWFFLVVGFILSIYNLILDPFILLFSPFVIIFTLWLFLPYIIFSIIAFKIKEKVLLIITGSIILLIDIYFHYVVLTGSSTAGILFVFTPIILIVLIFTLIGIGKLLKFTYSKFKK